MATLQWQRNINHPSLSNPIDASTVTPFYFCFWVVSFFVGLFWVGGGEGGAICSQILDLAYFILKFHLFHRFSFGIRTTNKYMDKMALSIEICPFWFLITSPKLPRRFLRLSGKKYVFDL